MEDNAGQDEKIIAVPLHHLTRRYDDVNTHTDLPTITLQQIEHFFEHYKDLERVSPEPSQLCWRQKVDVAARERLPSVLNTVH